MPYHVHVAAQVGGHRPAVERTLELVHIALGDETALSTRMRVPHVPAVRARPHDVNAFVSSDGEPRSADVACGDCGACLRIHLNRMRHVTVLLETCIEDVTVSGGAAEIHGVRDAALIDRD